MPLPVRDLRSCTRLISWLLFLCEASRGPNIPAYLLRQLFWGWCHGRSVVVIEVAKMRIEVSIQHDITGLDISVQDTLLPFLVQIG